MPTASPQPDEDESFVTLISSHQKALLAFLRTLMPASGDHDEVLQRTNLVLWRKRKDFTLGSNFKAWAFSVARWEVLAFLKEARSKNWLVYNDELVETIIDHMSELHGDDDTRLQASLAHCLNKLPPRHRELLLDRYMRGHSLRECAARTGRSEKGLKITFQRLRASLRKCITQHEAEPHLRAP